MEYQAMIVGAGGGYHQVALGTRPVVPPGPHDITVKLYANSLNYHDFAVVSGLWGPAEPRIPMADGAGEVVDRGCDVTEFKVGDRVVSTFFPDWLKGEPTVDGFSQVPGDGIDGYARSLVTGPATAFTHAPRNWTHLEAATLPTAALTAWKSLMVDDHLKPGATVVVQGTGGVSIFALQFAKLLGAKVIATSSSEEKLERLKEMGADHVINYQRTPNWGSAVLDLTNGLGADHILDVGGPLTLRESMTAARVGGHIALIGILTGIHGELSFIPALLKQLRLQGVLVGNRSQQQDMIRAIEANNLRPVLDRTYPLEDMVEAFKHLESQSHVGKIVLAIS